MPSPLAVSEDVLRKSYWPIVIIICLNRLRVEMGEVDIKVEREIPEINSNKCKCLSIIYVVIHSVCLFPWHRWAWVAAGQMSTHAHTSAHTHPHNWQQEESWAVLLDAPEVASWHFLALLDMARQVTVLTGVIKTRKCLRWAIIRVWEM